ncbi:HNH endonuclease [Pedobacter sp. UBA4863]|uniref:HNH endonuclease n=1 Tax=Pedobacter sp. UBA4863 TaxID=1947060 RepID=UPI0025F9A478|nr:HNH endonuclease [Pedobacter sp. UBA4863]
MKTTALSTYAKAFAKLKRGGTKYGAAPHKPILLLSIIELIEKNIVTDNRVFVDAQLVGTFKENWLLLVNTAHQEDFTQPFYYLQNERVAGQGYWFLQSMPGCQINAHIKSVSVLASVCAYGYLAADLWLLLNDAVSRAYLKQVLLATYFAATQNNLLSAKQQGQGYLNDQTSDLLEEPQAKYKHISKHTEEDVFVRNGLFKRLVPRLYQQQCSFTGMTLSSLYRHSFVDACHIIPFSHSQNDSVTNGIALCPNMHRAFDRGLLSIDENYRILVSEHLTEDKNHPYALASLKGKQIILPQQQNHYPAQQALAWHRSEVFKG